MFHVHKWLQKINDPDALLRLMPPKYQEACKTEFAAQWMLAKPGCNADGTFSEKALADTVNFAKAVGVLSVPDGTPFDPKKFFDNTYAEKSLAKTPAANRWRAEAASVSRASLHGPGSARRHHPAPPA